MLNWNDILSGGSLRGLYHLKLDLLTFNQAFKAVALDSREVDEDILFSIIPRQETKALTVIEPLHGSGYCHVTYSSRKTSEY